MRPTISKSDSPLTPEMLARAEARLGFKLPEEYVAFLREHNGGRPRPNIVPTPAFPGSDSADLHWFNAIDARLECNDLVASYETWIRDCPPNLLPIACDSGGSEFCLSVAGDDAGKVYYWDWYREPHPVRTRYPWIYPVADSLAEFLESFREFTPEELAAIEVNQFVWCTDWITAEICRDDEYLEIGQYLYIRQEPPSGTAGWSRTKLEIPEFWSVEAIKVADGAVTLRLADGQVFQLTRHNFGELGYAILDGGNKTDEELDRVWREHAQVPPPGTRP